MDISIDIDDEMVDEIVEVETEVVVDAPTAVTLKDPNSFNLNNAQIARIEHSILDDSSEEFVEWRSKQSGRTQMIVNSATPKSVIQNLMENISYLTPTQQVKLFKITGINSDNIEEHPCSSIEELVMAVRLILNKTDSYLEFLLAGRWYPIRVDCRLQNGFLGLFGSLEATVAISDFHHDAGASFSTRIFRDASGENITLPVNEALQKIGFRIPQINRKDFDAKLDRAINLNKQTGKVLSLINSGLKINTHSYFERLVTTNLGSPTSPRKVLIEADMETSGEYDPYSVKNNSSPLPFVRIFVLDRKEYVYADVDDLIEYKFDEDAINRLVLPEKEGRILRQIFTHQSNLFGDVIQNKHGGMVILANGTPGVGKTLTAEVFAEYTKRPLYVLEIGELGTNVAQLEEQLQKVFVRAQRWNAVLLLDEADVFMQKRDDDLERSAIVGVFLRLLDYYSGLLFLTTNRAETLDDAFKSRITLRLNYPILDLESRKKVWNTMLKSSKIELHGNVERVAETSLNGRQIRNMVRLISVLYPEKKVTDDQILEVMEHACR